MRTLKITDYKDLKGKSIKQIFNSFNKLEIPPYQRDFSWEASQLEAFRGGLSDISHEKNNHFFFGQIVTAKDGDNEEEAQVIDGQQRLTIFTIFIHCIWARIAKDAMGGPAKYFKSSTINSNNTNPANTLQASIEHFEEARTGLKYISSWFLQSNSDGEELYKRMKLQNSKHGKVWPIIFDESCDKRTIEEKYNTLNETEDLSHGDNQLYEAFMSIYDYVNDIEQVPLEKLINSFWYNIQDPEEKFRIHGAHLDSNSIDIGINLFTRMNATGKQLSPPDLIKAHLCSVADRQGYSEETMMKWMNKFEDLENMVYNISDSKKESSFLKFIKHYAWSKYGEDLDKDSDENEIDFRIGDDTTYDLFRIKLKDDKDINHFLNELEALFPLHKKLLDLKTARSMEEDSVISTIGNKVYAKGLQTILLRMRSFLQTDDAHYRILFFVFLNLSDKRHATSLKWNENDSESIKWITKICERLFVFLVRNKVCRITSQTSRPYIADSIKEAKKVLSNKDSYKSAQEVFKKITKVLDEANVGDQEVLSAIENNTHTSNTLLTNIIWEIEYHLRLEDGRLLDAQTLFTAETRGMYDLDHVCPKETNQWETVFKPRELKKEFNNLVKAKLLSGNTILFVGALNRKYKNKPFGEKLLRYIDKDLLTHKLMLETISENIPNDSSISEEVVLDRIKLKRLINKQGTHVFNTLWNAECVYSLSKKYGKLINKIFPQILS